MTAQKFLLLRCYTNCYSAWCDKFFAAQDHFTLLYRQTACRSAPSMCIHLDMCCVDCMTVVFHTWLVYDMDCSNDVETRVRTRLTGRNLLRRMTPRPRPEMHALQQQLPWQLSSPLASASM